MSNTYFWRSYPLNELTGSEIFASLFNKKYPITTLLESPCFPLETQNKLCRYSLASGTFYNKNNPNIITPKVGQIFPKLRELLDKNKPDYDYPNHLPFIGGWLGWLGYDCAWEIESLPYLKPDYLPFPVAFWYEPESFAILDHWEQTLWLASNSLTKLDELELLLKQDQTNRNKLRFKTNKNQENKLKFISDKNQYTTAVKKALEYIKAGDIFQANLSLRFQTETNLDSWLIYQHLHSINPSPFASYWTTPWGVIVSCSPERLIQLENNKAQTRPIAGTRPRGDNTQHDQELAAELLSNLKERAEHIMLIDLERNDLGRVCEWGSVKVDELLTIERYSHVMHLVSNVTGKLKSDYGAIDLITALFPGGTITGCPKVRCMEIIEELEPVRRSLFYGSCGYLDARGNLDLNILIRSLLLTYNNSNSITANVWGQVGAGIVADSDPDKEWYESLQKAQAQIAALNFTVC
jgi:para-aminobenzoate synthetase component 1